ncbi:hypothetical protein GCM10008915_48780 [Bifidobacterium pullorum subsp. gallinarum]
MVLEDLAQKGVFSDNNIDINILSGFVQLVLQSLIVINRYQLNVEAVRLLYEHALSKFLLKMGSNISRGYVTWMKVILIFGGLLGMINVYSDVDYTETDRKT